MAVDLFYFWKIVCERVFSVGCRNTCICHAIVLGSALIPVDWY